MTKSRFVVRARRNPTAVARARARARRDATALVRARLGAPAEQDSDVEALSRRLFLARLELSGAVHQAKQFRQRIRRLPPRARLDAWIRLNELVQTTQVDIGKSLVHLAEETSPPVGRLRFLDPGETGNPNEAAEELASFRSEKASLYEELPEHDDDEQIQRTESTLDGWIREGQLISAGHLSRAWHRSRQALDQARTRGELFGLRVRNRWWYPAVFEGLPAAEVARVCREMAGGDPVSMFIFWQRPHGALGARTVAEALRDGQLGRVCELARALAQESGWREADGSAA